MAARAGIRAILNNSELPDQSEIRSRRLKKTYSAISARPATGMRTNWRLCSSFVWAVFDGRYANNGWLQNCRIPLTKLAWDIAARLSSYGRPAGHQEWKI